MYNWADSVSFDNGPDEERDTCYWNKVRLYREKVANLVDWKPNGWQAAQPEKKEAEKVSAGGPRALRQVVWQIVVAGPN